MPLYHYTCTHGYDSIITDGGVIRCAASLMSTRQHRRLRVIPGAAMAAQLVWLTTHEHVTWFSANQVGLGMASMEALTGQKQCNRTIHRFEITEEIAPIVSWLVLRQTWPTSVVAELESIKGCRPDTWYVSRGPLHCNYSPNRWVAA